MSLAGWQLEGGMKIAQLDSLLCSKKLKFNRVFNRFKIAFNSCDCVSHMMFITKNSESVPEFGWVHIFAKEGMDTSYYKLDSLDDAEGSGLPQRRVVNSPLTGKLFLAVTHSSLLIVSSSSTLS